MVPEDAPSDRVPDELKAKVAALDSLAGRERLDGAADLAHTLVDDAVIIPFAFAPDGVYTSPRIGCQTVVPGIFNLDLLALCPK